MILDKPYKISEKSEKSKNKIKNIIKKILLMISNLLVKLAYLSLKYIIELRR